LQGVQLLSGTTAGLFCEQTVSKNRLLTDHPQFAHRPSSVILFGK
jgi:hypothetical protein